MSEIVKEEYLKKLREKQDRHLKSVRGFPSWKPCLHDSCGECHGTGVKMNGSTCVHGIYCDCPKCITYC